VRAKRFQRASVHGCDNAQLTSFWLGASSGSQTS